MSWIHFSPIAIIIMTSVIKHYIYNKTTYTNSWYDKLLKDDDAPDTNHFTLLLIVFQTLLAMPWSLSLSFIKNPKVQETINFLFVMSCILSLSWSIKFFVLHDITDSVIIIIFNVITILLLIWFLSYNYYLMGMMIIYALWMCYVLKIMLFVLNNNISENSHLTHIHSSFEF